MNPLSAFMWSWRTLRGHSITFAALFALGVLGVSAISTLRSLLTRTGAPWYIWLIVPGIMIGVLARKELQWVPELAERKKWARGIFFGSILASVLIAYFSPPAPRAMDDRARPVPQQPTFHKVPR